MNVVNRSKQLTGIGLTLTLLTAVACDEAQEPKESSASSVRTTESGSKDEQRYAVDIEHGSFWEAFVYAEANPDALPEGVNDWNCELTDAHPRPVVLVHGTWVNQYDSFAKMAPVLAEAGFCLYTFNFGKGGDKLPLNARYGTAALSKSVLELKDFTKKVRAETGSAKVDMVGWSQGGILIRSYLKDHGGADPADPSKNHVERVVTLGSPHHGTTLSGIALLGNLLGITSSASDIIGQGPTDQAIGSEFLEALNDGPDTVPGVTYTSIFTIYDEIANPVTSCVLEAGTGATVHNISVQDGCLIDFSEHLALPFTDRVIAMTAQGLDPDHEYRIPCKFQLGSL